jgi:hypothetical protein
MAAVLVLFPQTVVWLALRPGVGAMAGGVEAINRLAVDWGVGLRVEGAQNIWLAVLPATGIAAAGFIAWATLHLFKRIISRLHTISPQDPTATEQTTG